ncbi:MAG: hypothetical protein ACJA0U_001857 [Salibacteraceae bacterium]|jgi:uncharacterized protein (UPF0276 family)
MIDRTKKKTDSPIQSLPNLGLGLGLRHPHFSHILENSPEVGWFEIISENFMYSKGKPRHILNQIAERYPIVMHGVSMSIGSTESLNMDYLKSLKELATEIHPKWISDHLCWTGVAGANTHDLLPVPLNEETLAHIVSRIQKVQDYLQRPLIMENPSTYLTFNQSDIHEADFLSAMVERSGCGLLLDVNNTFVSCFNHNLDPVEYIEKLPHESIVQMHLAGHQNCGTHIIDTHDREVTNEVWELFHLAWKKTGGVSTLLEWDGNIPSFDECMNELNKAKLFMESPVNDLVNSVSSANQSDVQSTPIDFLVNPMMNETIHD